MQINKRVAALGVNLLVYIMCPVALAQSSSSSSFHIDEITYYQQLASARPDLLKHEYDAANVLQLRPVFRPLIFKFPNTYASLTQKYCGPGSANANLNKAWVTSQQTAELALQNQLLAQFHSTNPNGTSSQFQQWLAPRNIVKMGIYPMDQFVSYWVGKNEDLYVPYPNGMNLDCKLYFTFKDPFKTLTPEVYRGFADRLLEAGFTGDFKAYATDNQVYMNFNEIICHAGTPQNAILAENVGLLYFGDALTHESRGVDQALNGEAISYPDHLFLHRGSITDFPQILQAYLKYKI